MSDFLTRRDEAAFRALYRRHTPLLYGMARRLEGSRGDIAEDLVEETWTRALRQLPGFRWESELGSWLCAILVNCFREHARRRDSGHETLDEASRGAPPPAPEVRIDLEKALAELPGGYREVVVLHHVYGYTHREIAASLGIAEGTSKSQLSRGVARLREILTGADPEPAKGGIEQ